jgi:hypothetical protein
MGTVHDAIAACLAAELEQRTQWDEDPALYRLLVRGGRPRLELMRLHESIWDLDRPPAVVQHIAATMALNGVRSPDPDLFGIAFRHEGWGVDVDPEPGTPDTDPAWRARVRAVHADGLAHAIHARPDRYEVRLLYAVDRASVTYQIEQRRGEARATRSVHYPGADHYVTGGVPQALDLMVSTLTGLPAHARPADPGWLRETGTN